MSHTHPLSSKATPTIGSLEGQDLLMCEYQGDDDELTRRRICEWGFEQKSLHGISFASHAVLSCFANARQSGLVLDAGAGGCTASVVLDGWLVKTNVEYSKLGGQALDAWMAKTEEPPVMTKPIWDVLETQRRNRENDQYALPDGTLISEKVMDLLIDPSPLNNAVDHVPLHELVFTAATKQTSNEIRKSMLFNIIVCGGLAATENFVPRLIKELSTMARADQYRFISAGREDRHLGPWIGGSIVASLPIFSKELLVTKAEYEERGGVEVVSKKCA